MTKRGKGEFIKCHGRARRDVYSQVVGLRPLVKAIKPEEWLPGAELQRRGAAARHGTARLQTALPLPPPGAALRAASAEGCSQTPRWEGCAGLEPFTKNNPYTDLEICYSGFFKAASPRIPAQKCAAAAEHRGAWNYRDQREVFEIYYKSKLEERGKKGKKNAQHLTKAEVAAATIAQQCSSNGG